MSQESFAYGFVARGTVVLSEHIELAGNFPEIVDLCLQNLPSSNGNYFYQLDHYSFSFLVEDGYVYGVVAKESLGRKLSAAFLDHMKADFVKRYGGGKADVAAAKSLNKDFGPVMKKHMKYIIDHSEEIDQLIKVQAQVNDVKLIVQENIIKAIQRGEELTTIQVKAGNLRDEAKLYEKQGAQIRRKMWYQNMKIKLIVLGIIVLLALIIWLSVCGGFNCSN